VYHCYQVLVFQVDVSLSGVIDSQELWRTVQRDWRIDLSIHRIDIRLEGHQRVTVAGNSKDQVHRWVINDAVGIRHGGKRTEHGVSLQIEHNNRTAPATIGDKSTSQRRGNRRAMRPLLPRNIAQSLSSDGVDHHGVSASRD